jgi:Fe-S-cluster containining protein
VFQCRRQWRDGKENTHRYPDHTGKQVRILHEFEVLQLHHRTTCHTPLDVRFRSSVVAAVAQGCAGLQDGWYLLVNNACTHLLPDGRCGIYDDRPRICREYSNDFCEFDEPAEKGFELFFDGYNSLLRYVRKRFRTWNKYAASRDN